MKDMAPADAAPDDSIGALLSRVVSDAEGVARAEIELQKAKIVAKIDDARNAILLLLASVATGSVALTALVVGALMILTPYLGPLLTTVVVVCTLAGSSGLLGWFALRQFKLLFGSTEPLSKDMP